MYAICFDLDTEASVQREIRCILAKHGFSWQQGSVYFGEATSGCYGSKRTMI
jgi:virulence-associated protein VapD